jgi:hypothetical protein
MEKPDHGDAMIAAVVALLTWVVACVIQIARLPKAEQSRIYMGTGLATLIVAIWDSVVDLAKRRW